MLEGSRPRAGTAPGKYQNKWRGRLWRLTQGMDLGGKYRIQRRHCNLAIEV